MPTLETPPTNGGAFASLLGHVITISVYYYNLGFHEVAEHAVATETLTRRDGGAVTGGLHGGLEIEKCIRIYIYDLKKNNTKENAIKRRKLFEGEIFGPIGSLAAILNLCVQRQEVTVPVPAPSGCRIGSASWLDVCL